MKHNRLDQGICRNCNYTLDTATSMNRSSPKVGDISVCANCQTISVYTDNLDIRPMTNGEIGRLKVDAPDVYAHLKNVVNVLKNHFKK